MNQWHTLSTTDRKASDKVYEEAQAVLAQIVLEEK